MPINLLRFPHWIIFLLIAVSAGCGERAHLPPAPIGDVKALEKLAHQYQELANGIDTNLRALPAKDLKDFVVRVFEGSGYSYAATLHALAQPGVNRQDQATRDLIELVLMPHLGSQLPVPLAELYSADELKDVQAIEARTTP